MIKKSFYYLFIVYLIQLLSIVLNILFIRFLSLENLGHLTLAKVYFQLMDYSHLGGRFTMDRYIPTMNKKEGLDLTLFTLNISIFISIVTIFCVYLFIDNSVLILIFMLSGLTFSIATIYKAYFRAKEEFVSMMYVVFLTMLIPLIVQTISIVFFSFEVYIILFGCSYFFGLLLLITKFKIIKFVPIKEIIKQIKKLFIGMSLLYSISIVGFLSMSIDKLLLGHFKNSEILGEYSIILFVFVTLMIIPATLVELVFPKIIKKVETSNVILHIKETIFVFVPTLLAVLIANLVMDFFIDEFTKYSYLLSYLHLVSWAILPYAFISIMYHILNAMNKRKIMLSINIFCLFTYIISITIAINFSNDILFYLVVSKFFYSCLLFLTYLIAIVYLNKKSQYDVHNFISNNDKV